MSDDTSRTGEDTNFNLVPLLRHYEDKRRYPRVDLRAAVILTTADHQVLRARMRNLSAEGMQIRCDPETAAKLHPRRTQIVPGTGPEVMVRFDVDDESGSTPVAGHARLCYIVAKNPDEIAFGLQFLHLSLEAKKVLAGYLTECMRPSQ